MSRKLCSFDLCRFQLKPQLPRRGVVVPLNVIQNLLLVLLLALSLSSISFADQHQDDTKRAELYQSLFEAGSELEGREAEDALWRFWFANAPTPSATELLDAAIERREAYDFEAAENLLDELVQQAPDYAEGYNQRAFIRFLRDNLSHAKIDLEQTLALEPKHFGAWAGLYQLHSKNAETDQAFEALQTAVTIHPWLKERTALPKALWPLSYANTHSGKDI